MNQKWYTPILRGGFTSTSYVSRASVSTNYLALCHLPLEEFIPSGVLALACLLEGDSGVEQSTQQSQTYNTSKTKLMLLYIKNILGLLIIIAQVGEI